MRARWIWVGAAALYAVFALWYNNLRGPLTAQEIDGYMSRLHFASVDATRLASVRAFLEADDGGEFFMVNLLRFPQEPVPMPGTGEPTAAPKVLERYTNHFMPALFRRAGHPTFAARGVGGYVEDWGVEPDPGWSVAGIIRYRSRRDMMELATDPAFEPAHVYKLAAMTHTLAFPATGIIGIGPRVLVALVLALLAALGHIVLLTRRRPTPAAPVEAGAA